MRGRRRLGAVGAEAVGFFLRRFDDGIWVGLVLGT